MGSEILISFVSHNLQKHAFDLFETKILKYYDFLKLNNTKSYTFVSLKDIYEKNHCPLKIFQRILMEKNHY